jgi:hypothetical protein
MIFRLPFSFLYETLHHEYVNVFICSNVVLKLLMKISYLLYLIPEEFTTQLKNYNDELRKELLISKSNILKMIE